MACHYHEPPPDPARSGLDVDSGRGYGHPDADQDHGRMNNTPAGILCICGEEPPLDAHGRCPGCASRGACCDDCYDSHGVCRGCDCHNQPSAASQPSPPTPRPGPVLRLAPSKARTSDAICADTRQALLAVWRTAKTPADRTAVLSGAASALQEMRHDLLEGPSKHNLRRAMMGLEEYMNAIAMGQYVPPPGERRGMPEARGATLGATLDIEVERAAAHDVTGRR